MLGKFGECSGVPSRPQRRARTARRRRRIARDSLHCVCSRSGAERSGSIKRPGKATVSQKMCHVALSIWRDIDAHPVKFSQDVPVDHGGTKMSAPDESMEGYVPAELLAVAEAAGERLRAETDEEPAAADRAAEALLGAATSAMAAGCSLIEIARAEAGGKEEVRSALGGDALRRVERTGRQAREARAEHHQAIARAMRLGLSTREIAVAADVTHGTIRAINSRLVAAGSSEEMEDDRPSEGSWQGDSGGVQDTSEEASP